MNVLECSLNCVRKACDCRSINYKARTHQLYSKNYQLVNVTKTTHPQNLLPDENYDNYQPIEMVFTRFFYRFSKTILREACDKRPIYVLLKMKTKCNGQILYNVIAHNIILEKMYYFYCRIKKTNKRDGYIMVRCLETKSFL